MRIFTKNTNRKENLSLITRYYNIKRANSEEFAGNVSNRNENCCDSLRILFFFYRSWVEHYLCQIDLDSLLCSYVERNNSWILADKRIETYVRDKITINVPLFKKLRDIIFFGGENHFMSHFEGHFEGAKTFLTP